MKIVLVIFVVALGVWMLLTRSRGPTRSSRGPAAPSAPPSAAPAAPPAASTAGAQAMVSCAHCGVHVPQDEAFWSGTQAYCSDAHRLSGPRS
ncbi:MAG: hypothetical protein EBS16_04090 [Betaproteobacteria bacterium]|nr:hypothetical protein [Betaproteobacteria bacterium]